MKKAIALGLAVVILATLGGCGGQKPVTRAPQPPVTQQTAPAITPTPSVDVELAKRLLQTQGCSACHTLKAAGLDFAGNVGPDLTSEGLRGRTDEWLRRQITNPSSISDAEVAPGFAGKQILMPPFGKLSEQELASLIAFLQSLKGGEPASPIAPPSSGRDPVQIAKSVITVQGCGSCHTLKNADFNLRGAVGPDLSNEALRHRSQEWLRKQLTDPTSIPDADVPGYEGQQVVMPSYGRVLSDEELDAMIQYLMTLSTSNDKS